MCFNDKYKNLSEDVKAEIHRFLLDNDWNRLLCRKDEMIGTDQAIINMVEYIDLGCGWEYFAAAFLMSEEFQIVFKDEVSWDDLYWYHFDDYSDEFWKKNYHRLSEYFIKNDIPRMPHNKSEKERK